MKENWRPVVGWEGWYEVSDLGRVRSVAHISRYGRRKPSVVRKTTRINGYQALTLKRNNICAGALVHRLVLEAFVGPCPEGMQACHWNGNRADNSAANLRWGTARDNANDRRRHGTTVCGERSRNAKLRAVDVLAIRASREIGRVLAERYGVAEATVWRARHGVCWSHV